MDSIRARISNRIAVVAFAVATVITGAIVISTNASAVSDVSSYSTVQDALGANDISGQKDLTQQGYDNSTSGIAKVFWNWDDTTISGKNTLDGCVLFDSDNDTKANAAMCATVDSRSLKAFNLYTCGDNRPDRCDSPVAPVTVADPTKTKCYGLDRTAVGPFDSADTRVFCDVKLSEIAATGVALLNTCSYPSASPTSDPSDCVLVPGRIPTAMSSSSNSLIPNASVNLSGWTSGGSTTGDNDNVEFALFPPADTTCTGTAVYLESRDVTAAGVQATTNTSTYVITTGGTYRWRIKYYGNDVNLPSMVSCGLVASSIDYSPAPPTP